MIPAGGCNHEMILNDPPELKKKMAGRTKSTPEDKDTDSHCLDKELM